MRQVVLVTLSMNNRTLPCATISFEMRCGQVCIAMFLFCLLISHEQLHISTCHPQFPNMCKFSNLLIVKLEILIGQHHTTMSHNHFRDSIKIHVWATILKTRSGFKSCSMTSGSFVASIQESWVSVGCVLGIFFQSRNVVLDVWMCLGVVSDIPVGSWIVFGRFGTDFQIFPGNFGSFFGFSWRSSCARINWIIFDAVLFESCVGGNVCAIAVASIRFCFCLVPSRCRFRCLMEACHLGVLWVPNWKLGRSLWVHYCALGVCRASLWLLGLSFNIL